MQRLAITSGEPAGIGPDLVVLLAQQVRTTELVSIGDTSLLQQRAQQLNLPLKIRVFDPAAEAQIDNAGELCVAPVELSSPCTAGLLNPNNARYVLRTLDLAIAGCQNGVFDAMVTAPVHKGVINDAGIAFTGHTEYLAEQTNSNPVMLLATDSLRVALATTHLPLKDVAAAITPSALERVIRILNRDLIAQFGIKKPRILVCGLNPHAGEGGHMGYEEIDVIIPVLDNLRALGFDLTGPLPADTLFTPQHLDKADAVLAMFHDQGLPVLKYSGFGHAVNITLGLPIIRTSVDHGTALDKAGNINIDTGSLRAALDLAQRLIDNKRR